MSYICLPPGGGVKRVLFLNNYSMSQAMQGWKAGTYPGHHLWGVTGLEAHGFEALVPPFSGLPRLNRLMTRYLPDSWGDCDQQVRAALRLDYDIVYSACQFTTGLLARLRNVGLFRKPIVALLHHAMADDASSRAFLRGHDHLLCLNRRVHDQLVEVFRVPKERAELVEWGPELEFYRAAPGDAGLESAVVVSIGKTARDHDTLAAALQGSPLTSLVVGTPPTQVAVPAAMKVVPVYEHSPHMPYREVVRLCHGARIIAIPLIASCGLTGLTSLFDAMAVGRPVVITRNPFIDIDVEAEGLGFSVEPGDVAGWRRAMDTLAGDATLCREMGSRARALAERRYNIGRFTTQLAGALTRVRSAGGAMPRHSSPGR